MASLGTTDILKMAAALGAEGIGKTWMLLLRRDLLNSMRSLHLPPQLWV